MPDRSIGTLIVAPERLTAMLNCTFPVKAGTTLSLEPLTSGGVTYSVLLRGTPSVVLAWVLATPWITRASLRSMSPT